jgi:phosphoribosylformylglycinamidine cyclo-ligase
LLGGKRLGEALLATHRAYYRDVAPVLDLVDGMAHITGGGYGENLPRVLPVELGVEVETGTWEVPGIFKLIQQRGEVSSAEMYEVFNMGIGLVLYVAPANAGAVRDALPEALVIGRVVEAARERVTLRGLD